MSAITDVWNDSETLFIGLSKNAGLRYLCCWITHQWLTADSLHRTVEKYCPVPSSLYISQDVSGSCIPVYRHCMHQRRLTTAWTVLQWIDWLNSDDRSGYCELATCEAIFSEQTSEKQQQQQQQLRSFNLVTDIARIGDSGGLFLCLGVVLCNSDFGQCLDRFLLRFVNRHILQHWLKLHRKFDNSK